MRLIYTVCVALLLAGCAHSHYPQQVQADHEACLHGTTPNACEAYRLDIQKCSPVLGNPIAAGCY